MKSFRLNSWKRVFFSWVSASRSKLRWWKYRDTLPKTFFHDDIYLVTFPKSGTTWITFIIANIHHLAMENGCHATIFNIDAWVPDVGYHYLRSDKVLYPGHRFLKSHSNYNHFYKHSLYLIRNPKAVLVSYYYFLKGLGRYSGSLSDFIRDPRLGIHAWNRHVEGWFGSLRPFQYMHLMHYEDLREDPHSSIRKFYTSIGVDLDESLLAKAIEASSFEQMKASETAYRDANPVFASKMSSNLLRKGNTESYREDLSQDDISYIAIESEPIRNRYGIYTGEF